MHMHVHMGGQLKYSVVKKYETATENNKIYATIPEVDNKKQHME